MLGQVQIGLDRHTRTLNLITFSTLRNTTGVDVDIDKSCVFVTLHFFVLDAILSNSCRMGNFRSIQVLYRQKNHTMAPCIGSSSFLGLFLSGDIMVFDFLHFCFSNCNTYIIVGNITQKDYVERLRRNFCNFFMEVMN